MQDISGFGLVLNLIASSTFPEGISITQFADDADGFDMASISIADKSMGLNGDLIVWAKAIALPVSIAVIPGSDDDNNLQALLDANRVIQGKVPARDVITLTGVYPDGSFITYSGGRITDGMLGKSVSSSGREKSKVYVFTFQNKIGG